MEKQATWIETFDRQTQERIFTLRAGSKGYGHILRRIRSWDNMRAREQADRLCEDIEARAQLEGYVIH